MWVLYIHVFDIKNRLEASILLPDHHLTYFLATPISDRGNLSNKIWNRYLIVNMTRGYSIVYAMPMFFDMTNRLEASVLLSEHHLT